MNTALVAYQPIDVTHTYVTIDKSEWGAGPWLLEPDKIQGVDRETGLDVLIVRNNSGALCGYVGVPEQHPLFAVWYNDIEHDLNVHGGLTFSDFCQEGDGVEETGICHIPRPGRPERVWWFGFDCAHYLDFSPAYQAIFKDMPYSLKSTFQVPDSTYKDMRYVRAEVAGLARQLDAAWTDR